MRFRLFYFTSQYYYDKSTETNTSLRAVAGYNG